LQCLSAKTLHPLKVLAYDAGHAMRLSIAKKIVISSAVMFLSSWRSGNSNNTRTATAGLRRAARCVLSGRYVSA
jgi:hypothetical protein